MVTPCQPALLEAGPEEMGGKGNRKRKRMKVVIMIESDDKLGFGR
jgi:hypothetical protein